VVLHPPPLPDLKRVIVNGKSHAPQKTIELTAIP